MPVTTPSAVILAALVLTACGGSAGGDSSGTSSAASTSQAPSTPGQTSESGPATATLAVTGSTPALTGAIQALEVQCSLPQPVGTDIRVQGPAPGDAAVTIVVALKPGSIVIDESTGTGSTVKLREFTGTGISGYNDTVGAQVDTQLTEKAGAGSPGDLGGLTAIKGAVSCGAFNPGSVSNLAITATTPAGAVGGTPDTLRVTCHTSAANGNNAMIIGHIQVGSGPAVFYVSGNKDGVASLYITPASAPSHFYVSAHGATVTGTGIHVAADVTEASTRATAHVVADGTCGLTTSGP